MTATEKRTLRTASTWIGPFGIFLTHGIALGVFFMVLAFIVPTFAYHYQTEGTPYTPQFERILFASGHVVIDYWIPFGIIAIDAAIVALIARRGRQWLSTYSHLLLSFLAIATFVSFAWAMQPLNLNDAAKANAKNAAISASPVLAADL